MTDFGEHAKKLPGSLSDLTRELLSEIHQATHEVAMQTAVERSPVASGELKRSWESVPGSVKAAADALQPSKVRNAAPHALIIDRGRRRSENAFTVTRGGKTHTVRAGKMLGSTQAPLGVKGQVLRKVAAEEEAIFQRAVAAVDAKGDR